MADNIHDVQIDPRNLNILISVNGKLTPRAEAMVSVFDSGFILGDGVWEGLRLVKGGVPFLHEHIERLYEGAKAIFMDIGLTPEALVKRLALYRLRRADKLEGARACVAAGADVIVMDDGLQNPALGKSLRISVVDGAVGVGNGLCVPAGPLRAPLSAQWPHADALVVIGEGAPGEGLGRAAEALGKPVLRGLLAPEPGMALGLAGREVIAFAGIGRPEKFFDTLRALGAEVIETEAFPDHHAFTPREIAGLQARARRRGAALVTTEKDAARLGPAAEQMLTLPVRLALEDEAGLMALLGNLRA